MFAWKCFFWSNDLLWFNLLFVKAVCKDRIFPKIHVFAKGYGASENPRRAYFLAYAIGVAFICIGRSQSFSYIAEVVLLIVHVSAWLLIIW